ncbi:conserved hypothetical protein [Rippkaea orientalis PCC 8801]|uniref:Uncharacterized protein n=1 Tax=Rippkaea orientalis (strain PCC 8801 / RF-1) TaxID=41431 RepID=B7K473_RIPO1|nr:hypothetical protein [Rippkaea orientalis]ACK67779.1 conserved hypothetical protein [Rippkaea orientalis PCC 8801]
MSHFNTKSLIFYGTMIGSVLIFFKVVSAYGETQLKAPTKMGGTYPIVAKTLPQCLSSDQVQLTINQSGIYLFGQLTLSSANSPEAKATIIPLDGLMHKNHFSLSGHFKIAQNCPELAGQKLVIEGEKLIKEGQKKAQVIAGSLAWGNSSPVSNFVATANPVKTDNNHHH